MNKPTKTTPDRAARLWSVRQANASAAIEGGVVTPECAALQQRWIDGEISLDQLTELTLAYARRFAG